MLRLPPAAPQEAAVPPTYPSTGTPSATLPPAQAYQPAPGYQVATIGYQQQYDLQPTATAAYPSAQATGQYPYSNPAPQPAAAPCPAPSGDGTLGSGGSGNGPESFGRGPYQSPDAQGAYGGGTSGPCGPYRGPVEGFEQAAANGSCPNNSISWQTNGCCQWYGSLDGLVMNRSTGRSMWFSYNSTALTSQGNNSQFGLESGWGGEVDFGRRFCYCGVPYAVEATYWTTTDLTGSTSMSCGGAPNVNTVLGGTEYTTFNTLHGPIAGNTWFYGAVEQDLSRRDEFQDIEVNLIRERLACACDSPWDVGWSVGIRYFRFQDQLTYSSTLPAAPAAGVSDSAYMSDEMTNNLVGVQVGFDATYNFCNGLKLFLRPKVGIYGNYLDGNFQMQLGDHVTNACSTYYSQYYPVHACGDAFSFLTQIDVGAEWQFSRCWSARVGFRALAATGIGLAEDQFPQYVNDMPQLEKAESPSSLVLYGAFFGVSYCF
jgi:hypothetical protein